MYKKLKSFLPLAAAITGICLLVYVSGQQVRRQGANDPQIQIASDIKDKIESGVDPKTLVSKDKIDVSKSLSTFVIIYDDKKQVIVSSAILDNKTPEIPSGVLDAAGAKGINKVSWQPQDGVRAATIEVPFKGKTSGFVLVGRSLKEVETRENALLMITVDAWIAIIVVCFFLTLLI